jgi:hypothetical protein
MTTVSHTDGGDPADWVSSFERASLTVPAAPTKGRTRIGVAWRAAINYLVPIGYEEKTGFHYGEMSAPDATTNHAEGQCRGSHRNPRLSL